MTQKLYINKSFVCLISIALLLSVVGNARSADKDWTNGDGNRLWRTAANWSGGVPTSDDKAGIRNSAISGPIIDSSTAAEANQVVIGDWASTSDTLDMTGGTLATRRWFIMGYYGINSGTFTISGGTVNASGNLFVGFYGTGILNISGGTITVGSTFGVAQQAGGTGNVHLDSGTISCGGLNITSGGRMDITAGQLIVNGDARTVINGYIGSGWITAYDGSGTINVDYNVINPGKTTVTATTVAPVKATNPNPADGAIAASVNSTLSWAAGSGATSHDVYFGTTSPGTFRGNQTTITFSPGTLARNTIYYWRIDEKNANGTTTGDIWSFTTVPADDYFVGTYYYPWYGNNNFHNSTATPLGYTTLAYHLNPQITPELGWYNQNEPNVISRHYKWARYAGIDFFITSYWGQGKNEDNIIRNCMFDNPDRGNIKLAVFLEPSITPTLGNQITAAEITNQTNYLCDYYFNQPGYFRIDNKPVIFIYITRAMTDPNLTMCISSIRTAASDKGIGEVYIVGDEVWDSPNLISEPNRVSQMDAVTHYGVYSNIGRPRFATDSILNTWQSRNTSWKNFVNGLGKKFIPAVSPGFNDRGVRDGHQPSSRKLNDESNAFGTLFSGMLDRAKTVADMNMIMVTSWNEWHEDSQIEPTISAPATNNDDSGTQYYTQGLYYEGYGMRYLNILREKTTSFAFCDYDNDGQVGPDDLVFLADYWLETCTTGNDCIEADFTTDGTVDFSDFARCAKDWTGQ